MWLPFRPASALCANTSRNGVLSLRYHPSVVCFCRAGDNPPSANEAAGFATLLQPYLLTRILSGAMYYNGMHFSSLAEQFSVSIEAMAIRLEELKLVQF
jgi:hypothetical protein